MTQERHNDDTQGKQLPILRRDFLRLAAGSALATSGVLACSSLTGNDDDDDGGTTTITPEQRSAAILSITDKSNTLKALPREARIAAMLGYVNTRTEIIASGMNDDGVWAVLRDGTPLTILDNRDSADVPTEDDELLAGSGPEVPRSTQARCVHAMGPAFPSLFPRMNPLLQAKGYRIQPDAGSITSLTGVTGDGVFIINSHAGVVTIPDLDQFGNVMIDPLGNPTGLRQAYGVWTSTKYDPDSPNQYQSMIAAGELGVMIALHSRVIVDGEFEDVDEAHYCITPAFVANRMGDFGENSLVVINTCSSNSANSADFVEACLNRKAGLYVGWSNATNGTAVVATNRFVLDRLLGSNTVAPKENPPQRPFDYEETWADLHRHNLHEHRSAPSNPADQRRTQIVYSEGSDRFGLLAPSIQIVNINEPGDQAILLGKFGMPPANERAVLIGGLEAAVVTWKDEEIVCTLPRTGTGSAGNVVVSVRGHDSNIRRITEWKVPLRHFFTDLNPPHEVFGQGFVRFRADIGAFRSHAHDVPTKGLRMATATRDSKMALFASGVTNTGCSNAWSGEQEFPAAGFGTVDRVLIAFMRIDTDTGVGAIGLAYGHQGPAPFKMTITCPPPSQSQEVEFMVAFGQLFGFEFFSSPMDPDRLIIPLPAIQLTFGSNGQGMVDYSFTGGFVEEGLGLIRTEWDAVVPSFVPDPMAAV